MRPSRNSGRWKANTLTTLATANPPTVAAGADEVQGPVVPPNHQSAASRFSTVVGSARYNEESRLGATIEQYRMAPGHETAW